MTEQKLKVNFAKVCKKGFKTEIYIYNNLDELISSQYVNGASILIEPELQFSDNVLNINGGKLMIGNFVASSRKISLKKFKKLYNNKIDKNVTFYGYPTILHKIFNKYVEYVDLNSLDLISNSTPFEINTNIYNIYY